MSALAQATQHVTVEEYLASEELAPRRREYLGGFVYEMAGASESHNRISWNLSGLLFNLLRGGPCEYFAAEMKVKARLGELTYFYYPDGVISCDPSDQGRDFRERPAAIFEISSESTRGIDEREKRMAYRQIPGLVAYVRIEQFPPKVLVERPTESGWEGWEFSGLDAVAELGLHGLALPLRELYERVVFPT